MGITFPGESAAYRAARDELLQREIDLRRAMEEVAEARRRLPPGGPVPEDYAFGGPGGTTVRLSELFDHDSLVVYSMMFPRDPEDERPGPVTGRTAMLPLLQGPCPSCTALLDQLDGAAGHVAQRLSFVVVGEAPQAVMQHFADERGWRRLRLLSALGTSYSRDYHGQTAEGHNRSMLNVFHRYGDGVIRHFWGTELLYAPPEPGQEWRHVGTLEPLWNMFDLIPEGRGTGWDEQIIYPEAGS
jgi:predicted dithiol-disulfide oxidoreductase (DUF899 family)